MKKQITLFFLFLLLAIVAKSQTATDLFKASGMKISWLGVDFSHVKLIGDFSQFADVGEKSVNQIRDQYFPKWNKLILAEPNKYDIKGMLRKDRINNDIDMIMTVNSRAVLEEMEAYETPNYTLADIKDFTIDYNFVDNDGIGILFLAESMNKNLQEAYFHFVAINKQTKEILIHKRLKGKPSGFGLRNYWAGSIYSIIKDIRKRQYRLWKKEYSY